ncbi:MAG: hypothetical protein ACYTF1_09310 [Planctomycetota bacterium]|jgi:hypothetical protein
MSHYISPALFILLLFPLTFVGCWPLPEDNTGNVTEGDLTHIITLFQDSELIWDEIWLCGSDDPTNIVGEMVFGGGTASGTAELSDAQGQGTPTIGIRVSAPSGVDSLGMKTCAIQSNFDIGSDSTALYQSGTGSIVCDVTHLATIGESHNYIITIELSVSGGTDTQVYDTQKMYCLQTSLPELTCNQPYQIASEERMTIPNLTFEMGQSYTVELEVTVSIQGTSAAAQSNWGGTVNFDLGVDRLKILFNAPS